MKERNERPPVPKEARLLHLINLERAGVEAYPAKPPLISHSNVEVVDRFDELDGSHVDVVGRIVAKRDHGKTVFYDIVDNFAKLQVVLRKKEEDDGTFDLIRDNVDTGDFIGVGGDLFKTRTGEETVKANRVDMLAKALMPPPSEHVGVNDETARRRRYLELMASPDARRRFKMRSRMIQIMREEFLARGILEVETPVLDVTYGGALAEPFTTKMKALSDKQMYLRIAPELYLKRLLIGNMGPVFEFARNFRNEGIDATHNPEFTQVEIYVPYADYNAMMELAETTLERAAIDLHGTTLVQFGEHVIDFKKPWRRLSVFDGLRNAYGIDPEKIADNDLLTLAIKHGIEKKHLERRGDMLLALFEDFHDKSGDLIQPTFVTDYPKITSALTKKHRKNPDLVERFELYVAGMEVGNSYTELNDPRDQRARFEEEALRRLAGDTEAMPTDEDFLLAMEYGMPPMGGIGIGIDRMAMILTNTPQIRDVILFPQVKER